MKEYPDYIPDQAWITIHDGGLFLRKIIKICQKHFSGNVLIFFDR